MPHTRTWDAAYETTPPNTQNVSQGAQRIRELKVDIRERLDLDHVMDDDDTNDGRHRLVSLIEQASDPGNLANQHLIYSKDVAGVTEIFFRDDSGDIQQITNNGALLLLATNNAFTKGQATTEVDVTFAVPLAFDASLSNSFKVTLTANFVFDKPTNMKSGQVCTLRFIQDATGSRVMTIGSSQYKGNLADDLILSTGVNDIDIMTIYFDGTDHYIINLKKDIGNALP